MKYIMGNRYFTSYQFSNSIEASIFFNAQKAKTKLFLDDTFGSYHFCYVCGHSLTGEIELVLSFDSETSDDYFYIMNWNSLLLFVIGKRILIFNANLEIIASIDISVCVLGLYILSEERLLILEEIEMKVIDNKGEIVMKETFDLMDTFSLNNNLLTIQTNEGSKIINLI